MKAPTQGLLAIRLSGTRAIDCKQLCEQSGTRRGQFRRGRLIALLAATVLTVGACTNSKFLVGAFYNRADNRVLTAIDEWLDLDDSQKAEARAYIGTFHTWHRRTQLPLYAELIRDITTTLSTYDQATPEDFDRFFDTARARVEAIRECHPAHFAVPFGKTLSAAQIDQAEQAWIEERDEDRERFGSRTQEQRVARRMDRTKLWLGRLGFELKATQITLIERTLRQQQRFGPEFREILDGWYEELFTIARASDAPDYEQRLSSHVTDWFGIAERDFPEVWEHNQALWRNFAVSFEKTLSQLQRRTARAWLNKFARTLDGISRDTPDWLPADDPAYGCVVDTAANVGGTAGSGN